MEKRSETKRGGDKGMMPGGSVPGRTRFVYLLAIVGAVGGFLFGYDTGVISGALLYLRTEFHLTPTMVGTVTAVVLAGAVVGAATSGALNDRMGRRAMLIYAAILFGIGAVATAFAVSIPWIIFGRFIVGYGIGVASYTSPLYISECAPAEVRGALVSLSQLAITVGIVVAYLVDLAFAYAQGWRWMFGLAIVPAFFLGIGMAFLPDSPRSLMNRGYGEEARRLLERIRGKEEKEEGLKRIQEVLGLEKPHWGELMRPSLRPAMVVGMGLAIFQQFIGINTVIYYAPTIFQYANFGSASVAILHTIGVGVVNVGFTVVAIFLLDRLGRRPLLFIGVVGMIITLALLGYDFMKPEAERGPLALVGLMAYVAAFAISLGPIFWLIISEIYPLRIRGRAMSVATVTNWLANLLITFTFPLMIAAIGPSATFWIYAAIGVIGFFFCWSLVPETKGRTLEEIEKEWFNLTEKGQAR
jgi:SP family galactose:H+ symporter-like MFS transporter